MCYLPIQTVDVSQKWERLHSCSGQSSVSCTALSVNPPDVVTVGEDGRINVVRIEMREPLLTIGKLSILLHSVCIINQSPYFQMLIVVQLHVSHVFDSQSC